MKIHRKNQYHLSRGILQPESSTDSTSSTDGQNSPQTGDVFPTVGATALLVAGAGIVFLKRKNNLAIRKHRYFILVFFDELNKKLVLIYPNTYWNQ